MRAVTRYSVLGQAGLSEGKQPDRRPPDQCRNAGHASKVTAGGISAPKKRLNDSLRVPCAAGGACSTAAQLNDAANVTHRTATATERGAAGSAEHVELARRWRCAKPIFSCGWDAAPEMRPRQRRRCRRSQVSRGTPLGACAGRSGAQTDGGS